MNYLFVKEEEHLMNGDSNHMYESNELTQQEMYEREQQMYQVICHYIKDIL